MNKKEIFGNNSIIINTLNALFEELRIRRINYCIMSSFQDLPKKIDTDIDISIDKNGLRNMDKIIMNLLKNSNLKIVQKIHPGYNQYAYILSPINLQKPFRLQLDFFIDFSFKGLPSLLQNEFLLKNKRTYKNYFVPDEKVAAVYIILRRILKEDMNEEHITKLNTLYLEDSDGIQEILKNYFNEKMANKLIGFIRAKDDQNFRHNTKKFKRNVLKMKLLKISLTYFQFWISEISRVFKRFIYPVGMWIVFLGPDGVGKSTIAKEVSNIIWGSFHGIRRIYWRPGLIPPFGRIKFWEKPQPDLGINPRPHDHTKQSRIISFIRFFYYALDFIVGYYPKIYLPMVKRKLVVMDRYYYDFMVDLQRYNFNIPKWLPKIILPIIPKPDLVFYLYNEPQNIIERKKELPLSEVERQIKDFNKIITQLPNAHPINTEGSIKEISSKIVSIILEKKAADTRKTLNLK